MTHPYKFFRLAVPIVAFMFSLSGCGLAVSINSCADLRDYLRVPLPDDTYRVKQDLQSAVEFLDRGDGDCPLYDTERARWAYADALDRYSQSFGNDLQATRHWSTEAAKAYGKYLDWFMGLDAGEQDELIRTLTNSQRATPKVFEDTRRRWLRRRVGNALHSMGACHERAKDYKALLANYQRVLEECDMGELCLAVFPNEVVSNWYKWLRTAPVFDRTKSEAQIRQALREDDDLRDGWTAFRDFLDRYVPLNPSVRDQWTPVRRKVNRWLEEA